MVRTETNGMLTAGAATLGRGKERKELKKS